MAVPIQRVPNGILADPILKQYKDLLRNVDGVKWDTVFRTDFLAERPPARFGEFYNAVKFEKLLTKGTEKEDPNSLKSLISFFGHPVVLVVINELDAPIKVDGNTLDDSSTKTGMGFCFLGATDDTIRARCDNMAGVGIYAFKGHGPAMEGFKEKDPHVDRSRVVDYIAGAVHFAPVKVDGKDVFPKGFSIGFNQWMWVGSKPTTWTQKDTSGQYRETMVGSISQSMSAVDMANVMETSLNEQIKSSSPTPKQPTVTDKPEDVSKTATITGGGYQIPHPDVPVPYTLILIHVGPMKAPEVSETNIDF